MGKQTEIMKRICEDCGAEYEGTRVAHYCVECRLRRNREACLRRSERVRTEQRERAQKAEAIAQSKPKRTGNRFTCTTCQKWGRECQTMRKGVHTACWVSMEGETAAEAVKKPRITVLPPAAPRALPKRSKPEDYLSFCVMLAEDQGKTYGKFTADTTEEWRRQAWRRYK